MALSQNTLKKIKRLLKGRLFPPKDVNAMLKSILVTTANGKPQTASSRLPFAVNAVLKVSSKKSTTTRADPVVGKTHKRKKNFDTYISVSVYKGASKCDSPMLEDDFQSALRSLGTPTFVNLTRWNANRCYSLRTTYLIFEAF